MTPGELYDLLQRTFGLGDYDEHAKPEPAFFRQRATEIGKIKLMLKRRRCSPEEVALAADYAVRHGKAITASWQVFSLVPDAIREQRVDQRARARQGLRQRLIEAAQEAHAAGREDWAQRLFAASPEAADTVLAQWEEEKLR